MPAAELLRGLADSCRHGAAGPPLLLAKGLPLPFFIRIFVTNYGTNPFKPYYIMKSDPKECLYCQSNETLHNLMIEVAELSVSRVFIFKEQTYRGRCLVAYKDHVDDINLLGDDDRNAFMSDVVRVTRAMQKVFNPDKINYGAYADTLEHLHFHLVPKYVGGPDFGGVFRMNPQQTYLTEAEYASMAEALRKEL